MSGLPSGVDQSPRAMALRMAIDMLRGMFPYLAEPEVERAASRMIAHAPVLVHHLSAIPSPEAERKLRQQARHEVSPEEDALEMKRQAKELDAAADAILIGVESRYAPDFDPDERDADHAEDRAREARQREAGADEVIRL